eukprot:10214497-Ditylum_brightwellii.AAC.1
MEESGTRNKNNDEASVSTNLTGVDMNESNPVTNQSVHTVSESDDASHITTLAGLTMEGKVNQEGTVNKNHSKIRADMQILDINNSGSDDVSQNTAVTVLIMKGNSNNDT